MLVLNFEVLGGFGMFFLWWRLICVILSWVETLFSPVKEVVLDVLQFILSRVPVLVELLHSDFKKN